MKQLLTHKTVSLLAKLALTLGAFWYALSGLDMAHLEDIWNAQDRSMVIGAAACIAIQLILGSWRWRMIMYQAATAEDKLNLTRWQAFEIYAISAFSSICVPGGAMGTDVIRIWLTKARHIPLILSVNSVIIDRVVALIMLLVLVLVCLPQLGQIMGFDATPFLWGTVVLAVVGLWAAIRAEHFISARFSHVPPVRWLLHLTAGMRRFIAHPLKAMVVLVYAVIGHLLFCAAVYVLAQSMNISLSVEHALVLIPPIILAITLPISMGGWGVREMGMAGMLSLVGVPKAAAVLLSVQMGIIAVVVYLPAGILWLSARNKWQQAKHG